MATMCGARASRAILSVLLVVLCLPASANADETLATYSLGAGWATFGLALPPGKAFSSVVVGSLPTQTDVKVRYADQSIRFAVVTARIPSAGTYAITDATRPTGAFAPTLPSASVSIIVAGQTFVAQLPSAVAASWLDGPLVREGRTVQAFSGATGAAASLRAIFDVRSYAGGGHRVDVTVSNTANVSTAREVAYGVTIRVNGAAVFTRAGTTTAGPSPFSVEAPGAIYTARNHGLSVGDTVRTTSGTGAGTLRVVTRVIDSDTVALNYGLEVPLPVTWERLTFVQPYLTRWRKTFLADGLTEADVTPDFRPFQSAGALPAYLSLVASPTPSSSGPWFEPLRIGDLTHPLNAPGSRPALGLYPAWVPQYMVHKTAEQRAYMLAMGGNVAGAISLHIDDTDGAMLSLDSRPGFFLSAQDPAGAGGPAGNLRGVLYAAEVGAAHTPSLAYVPYLLTGDRFYLEEMQYWANAGMLSWTWLRNGAAGLVTSQQIRAMAWEMRDLADTAAYSPDDDPRKEYFAQKLANNITDLDRMAAAEPDPLGGSVFATPFKYPQQIFMQSFAAWGFDHVGKQGFRTPQYAAKLARYWNDVYSANPAFDRRYVIAYQINIADVNGAPFRSFADLFDYNYNRRPVDPWKNYPVPAQTQGYSYNKAEFVLLVLAQDLGLNNAGANLDAIYKTAQDGGSTQSDLSVESQYAIAPADVSVLSGSKPRAPANLHRIQ